ncbi:MAG: pyrroline-5-carboxylate reductase [Clostridiales bacterium]|nr:pyrroline-5-carboxylate reductase [Clostridiales bacterium]
MNIGFIGVGNMGGAIVRGYSQSAAMKATGTDALFVFDSDKDKVKALAGEGLPVKAVDSIEQLAGLCDVIVLCVKPNAFGELLDELAGVLGGQPGDKLIISIAAGISIGYIRGKLGTAANVVRVMPNTPAMVGEGMSAMSASDGLPEKYADVVEKLFSAIGSAVWVDEPLMDIVTGISGSSPAYAYLYMEGLVQAGIQGGLSKRDATILAAQSTLGAAKMVLENLDEVEPRQLCANVCSPGGTTIEAVKVLEDAGFTETVSKAAQASAAKSKLMTR